MFEPAPAASPAGAPCPGRPAPPGRLRRARAARRRCATSRGCGPGSTGCWPQARRGRTFSPQELLCLQADAHRFAQTVEFAARAVEHGVQGLRQALNAQV